MAKGKSAGLIAEYEDIVEEMNNRMKVSLFYTFIIDNIDV